MDLVSVVSVLSSVGTLDVSRSSDDLKDKRGRDASQQNERARRRERRTNSLDRSIEGEDVVGVVVVVSNSRDGSEGENDVLGSRDVRHRAVSLHQVSRIALEEADTVSVGLADLRGVEGGIEEAG